MRVLKRNGKKFRGLVARSSVLTTYVGPSFPHYVVFDLSLYPECEWPKRAGESSGPKGYVMGTGEEVSSRSPLGSEV